MTQVDKIAMQHALFLATNAAILAILPLTPLRDVPHFSESLLAITNWLYGKLMF